MFDSSFTKRTFCSHFSFENGGFKHEVQYGIAIDKTPVLAF